METEVIKESLGEIIIKRRNLSEILEERISLAFFFISEGRSNSTFFSSFLIITSFIQVFSMVYDQNIDITVDTVSYPQIISFLLSVRISSISALLANPNIFVSCIYIGFAILSVYLVLSIFAFFTTRSVLKEASYLLVSINLLAYLIYWIFTIPIADVFFTLFKCPRTEAILGITCWSIPHFTHVIVFSVSFVIFLLANSIFCFFGCVCNPYSKETLSRYDWNFEFFYFFFRVVLVCLVDMTYDLITNWIISVYVCLGGIAFIWYYLKYIPYYNRIVSNVFGACVFSYGWIIFVNVGSQVFNLLDIDSSGVTLIIAVGIISIVLLTNRLSESKVEKILCSYNYINVPKETDFNLFMSKLIDISNVSLYCPNSKSKYQEVLLNGYIATHKLSCTNPECPLNSEEDFFLPISNQFSNGNNRKKYDTIVLRMLVEKMYKLNIAKAGLFLKPGKYTNETMNRSGIDRGALTCISYAFFLIDKIGNLHQAALQIALAEYIENGIKIKHICRTAKIIIEEMANEKNKKSGISFKQQNEKKSEKDIRKYRIDIRNVILYEEKYEHFVSLLSKSANLHLEFWKELENSQPNLQHLNKNGEKILKKEPKIKYKWKDLNFLYQHDPKAEAIYGKFLINILGKHDEGLTHLSYAIKKEENKKNAVAIIEKASNLLFNDNTAVIVSSAMQLNQGKILKASNNTNKIFGFAKRELLNHYIEILIPEFFSKHHKVFTQNFIETGKKKIMDTDYFTFGLHRNGFLMPIQIVVKHFYDFYFGSVFTALITLKQNGSDTIITDSSGQIVGITEGAAIDFGDISPQFLLENQLFISFFCGDLKISDTFLETDFKKLVGCKKYSFRIPCHNANLVNALNSSENLPKFNKHSIDDSEFNMKRISTSKSRDYGNFNSKFNKEFKERNFEFYISNIENVGNGVFLKVFNYRRHLDFEFEEDSGVNIIPTLCHIEIEIIEENKNKPKMEPEKKKAAPKNLIRRLSNMKGMNASKSSLNMFLPNARTKKPEANPGPSSPSSKFADQSSTVNLIKPPETEAINVESKEALKPKISKSFNTNNDSCTREINELRNLSIKKFQPQQIFYIKLILFFSSFTVFLIALISFCYETSMICDIRQYKQKMNYTRIIEVLEIAEATRSLLLMSTQNMYGAVMIDDSLRSNLYNYSSFGIDLGVNSTYLSLKTAVLQKAANTLLDIQSDILWLSVIAPDSDPIINPENVQISYSGMKNQNNTENVYMETAIFMYANQALDLYYSNISTGVSSDISFILKNGYCNLQYWLKEIGIVLQSLIIDSFNLNQLIVILTIVFAFAFGIASILFLIIKLYQMHCKKAESLALLLDIKIKKVKNMVKECSKFRKFAETEEYQRTKDEINNLNDESELEEEKNISEGKIYKVYKGNLKSNIIKLSVFLLIEALYFLLNYFLPVGLENSLNSHSEELIEMKEILIMDEILFSYTIEILGTNATTTTMDGIQFPIYLASIIDNLMDHCRQLQEIHTNSSKFYSANYNENFAALMNGNVCNFTNFVNMDECNTFMGGLNVKGLTISTIGYIKTLEEVLHDYINQRSTSKTASFIQQLLNDQRVINSEILKEKYLYPSYVYLIESINSSLDTALDSSEMQKIIIFAVFIVYLAIVNVLFVPSIILRLKKDLYSGYAILYLIPTDLILKTERIKMNLLQKYSEIMNQS